MSSRTKITTQNESHKKLKLSAKSSNETREFGGEGEGWPGDSLEKTSDEQTLSSGTSEEVPRELLFDPNLVTSGNILDDVLEDPKISRRPFLCPWATPMRYENIIPTDVTNDHQYQASVQKTVLEQKCNLTVTSEPDWGKQSSIVATVGPSCHTVEKIESLMRAGANIFRVNMSYGDRCSQQEAINNIKAAAKSFVAKIGFTMAFATIVDLKGPEIRTGRIHRLHVKDPTKPQMMLKAGSTVKLTTDKTFADKCSPKVIYLDYKLFPKLVRPGMKIYMNDGVIKARAESVDKSDVICIIEYGGCLGNRQQVHIPMIPNSLAAITDQDVDDIEFAVKHDVDFIAVPRVQNASTIFDLKGKLIEKLMLAKKQREKPIMILAKISTFQGLQNVNGIIEAADGIIIQRGDLGLEIPLEKVYVAQKEIIGKCNMAGKPVICSTQLMNSMIKHPRANRSEIFDVGGCIHEGADCMSLSAETAIGKYPYEVVSLANHIIREAEAATVQRQFFFELVDTLRPPIEPKVAISIAAVLVAAKIRATAIVVISSSGQTAQILSWFRPRCIVIGITRFERTARQMNLWRAVVPLHYGGPVMFDWFHDIERQFQYGIAFGKEAGFIRAGDALVLVSAFSRDANFANSLRVVYASTEPEIFIQHAKEFYDVLYLERDDTRPQDKIALNPCK